jgi:hypothetical protein
MHHSAFSANARYLLCSTRPWGELGATTVGAPWLTWDVIIPVHQAGR